MPPRTARTDRGPNRQRRVSLGNVISVVALGAVGLVVIAVVANALSIRQSESSHIYPPAFVNRLMADCRAAGGTESYCTCTLQKVQGAYTYGEFTRLQPEHARNLALSYGRECAGESHDYGPAFRETFFKDCAEAEIAPERCACMIERVQQRFTVAEYARIEAQLLTTGTPPPALAEALAACDE